MSVYLDDAEMERFLDEHGLSACSNDELLAIAKHYDRLGHAESSCGAWFMRYSIIGFVERRQEKNIYPEGDPETLADFMAGNFSQTTPPMPRAALEIPKPAKFTAEELRKIEDAVKKEIDEKDELRQAVAYVYLNGLGWRMTKAQRVIDKALK